MPHNGKRHAGKPRARWNSACDAILLEVLIHEKGQGFQASNGNWHPDVWTAVEKKLAGTELNSGGIVKTASSCQGRWDALKRDFVVIRKIRGLSGFGWNDAEGLVTAPADVWKDLLAKHPNWAKWRKTSFPLYDDIFELIEGTYATGDGVFRPGHDGIPDDATDESRSVDAGSDRDAQFLDDDAFKSLPSHMVPIPVLTPSTAATTHFDTPDLKPVSRKRSAADSGQADPVKRQNRGRKPTGSQAVMDVASSIDRLASAFSGPGASGATGSSVMTSPERKRHAIHLIEDDSDLSENERISAFKLMRRDTSFADTILAIRSKETRTRFIQITFS